MIRLNYPVGSLSMIGPKYKGLLAKLGVYTVENLLYHFPFRYDDFSQIKKIGELVEGEISTVEAVLGPVQNIFTRNAKRITRAKAYDHTGDVDLIWFNQHYLKKSLQTGGTYLISGKVGLTGRKYNFMSPEMELKTSSESINTGRLVPIYPETLGLSSKWLRSRINDVLIHQNYEEFLPKELLENKNLKDFMWSLKEIHFPDSPQQAEIAKNRFAFEELFMELLNVEKRNYEWSQKLTGSQMKPFQKKITDFVASLPFKLTSDQNEAISQIVDDMQKTHPMNRLLEGDVGTGKTVVALVAAYLAHLNGYKTIYMAPTEILASQHYETFNKLLPNLKITLVSGGSTKKEGRSQDLSGVLPESASDIIIGTHALLYTPKKYEKIGLVVIDEQHRFGVEQRGQIMELSKNSAVPHLLSMTATPIPRTLALTLYGDLSLSVLKTHPNIDRKISTKVVPDKNRELMYGWIRKKSEPTFIVCPLIDESEAEDFENVRAAQKEFTDLQNTYFQGVKMGLLHGRMKSKEKKEMMEKFRSGEVQVLVSTPVIEVGMDVPDATIMVIESAERYGLASLHQLRGRVGRGKKEGFCFAVMGNSSRTAYTRLKNLEELNDGLKLAEIDMKLRGQGDVFGTMQHGFKRLKVADLSNIEMLEEAKVAAQDYFGKLAKYPLLEQRLTERLGKYIPSN